MTIDRRIMSPADKKAARAKINRILHAQKLPPIGGRPLEDFLYLLDDPSAPPSAAWMDEQGANGDTSPAIADATDVDIVRPERRAEFLFLKNAGHRYKTADELAVVIVEYLKFCSANSEPVTLSGLALFTGHNSPDWFNEYSDEFRDVAERARLLVAYNYELKLLLNNSVGAIFGLKNLGWSDSVKFDGKIQVTKKQVFQIGDTTIEFG